MFADFAEFWTNLFENMWLRVSVLAISSAASFIAGRWFGQYRASRDWKTKHFLNRLQVTLNGFQDGTLQFRTLLERPLEEVFFNSIAMKKVIAASQRTTVAHPFLEMQKDDAWFLLNFVLNAISEQFSLGVVRKEAGECVKPIRYALFLTCEPVEHGRVRKIRAMLIRPETLREFPYLTEMPKLEQPWHDIRVRTLRRAAELYRARPENFLEVEICV